MQNKDADQLCSNCTFDQRVCFHDTDNTIPLLLKSEISSFLPAFYNCTGWFVSGLVVNPDCYFSHAQTHLALKIKNKSVDLLNPYFAKRFSVGTR